LFDKVASHKKEVKYFFNPLRIYDGAVNLLKFGVALVLGATQLTAGQSITGTIRFKDGDPAAGVRVVALAAPSGATSAGEATVLASLTQTDSNGRYRLTDVPPGRYLIAVGPVSFPTYYPGTLRQTEARAVTIAQDGAALSGIDFAVAVEDLIPPPPPGVVCCNLTGLLLTSDGSPLPAIPLKVVDTANNLSVAAVDGFFRFSMQRGTAAQFAVEGLPTGYALKSIVYGGRNPVTGPIVIDGREPQALLLMIDVTPGSTLPRVQVRGKAVNFPRELKPTTLSLLLPAVAPSREPVAAAPIQPDYSFEFSGIPIGTYRPTIRDAAGNVNAWVTTPVMVIREAVSDLTIDFRDDPFPEGARFLFSDGARGNEKTITGIATQRLTPLVASSIGVYFRMDVKETDTGAVTPWAIYVAQSSAAPNIVTGQTYTVRGTPANDGTHRLSAEPF
jgi:hypothetical protein